MALVATTSVVVAQQWATATQSSGERPVLVPITPCRLLDTRGGNELQPNSTITVAAHGTNGACTIPTDAIGLSTNMTAVDPTAWTYLTVWPEGPMPVASSLNPVPGQPPTPNAVTVSLSGAGSFKVYNFDGRVELIVDIDGYYVHHDHHDLYYTRPEIDAMVGAHPARVIWVAASGGDFGLLSEALAAIGTTLPAATETAPYLIKVGPGEFEESAPIALESFVDIEGSGREVTTLTCECGGSAANGSSATMRASGGVRSEVRHLTIVNEGSAANSYGFHSASTTEQVSLLHVAVDASGGSASNTGVVNDNSATRLDDVLIDATGGQYATGISNINGSYPSISDSTIEASAGTTQSQGIWNIGTSPSMRGLTVTVPNSDHGVGVINNNAGAPRLLSSSVFVSGDPCTGILNHGSYGDIEGARIVLSTNSTAQGIVNEADSRPLIKDVTIDAYPATMGGSYTSFTGVDNSVAWPVMHGIVIAGSAGGTNVGVQNTGAGPEMSDIVIELTATGGGTNVGVENLSSSDPRLSGVDILLRGASTNTGIRNDASSSRIHDVEVNIEGGAGADTGILNSDSTPEMHTVWIYVSSSGGDAHTILNQASSNAIIDDLHAFVDGDAGDHAVLNKGDSRIQIRNSTIGATTGSDTIHNADTSVAFVANTILEKAPAGTSGSYHKPYGNVLPDFTPITTYP